MLADLSHCSAWHRRDFNQVLPYLRSAHKSQHCEVWRSIFPKYMKLI